MSILTISDELHDDVIIYKLFNNPTLLETLKRFENIEIIIAVEPFCFGELKVCKIFYFSQANKNFTISNNSIIG